MRQRIAYAAAAVFVALVTLIVGPAADSSTDRHPATTTTKPSTPTSTTTAPPAVEASPSADTPADTGHVEVEAPAADPQPPAAAAPVVEQATAPAVQVAPGDTGGGVDCLVTPDAPRCPRGVDVPSSSGPHLCSVNDPGPGSGCVSSQLACDVMNGRLTVQEADERRAHGDLGGVGDCNAS